MLNDKVYLWLVVISCLALAVAGTLAVIELVELQDPAAVQGANPF
jgi:hypothetical protein